MIQYLSNLLESRLELKFHIGHQVKRISTSD